MVSLIVKRLSTTLVQVTRKETSLESAERKTTVLPSVMVVQELFNRISVFANAKILSPLNRFVTLIVKMQLCRPHSPQRVKLEFMTQSQRIQLRQSKCFFCS